LESPPRIPLDLDPATRAALELDAVLESVAAHASTLPGARMLREACPVSSLDAIRSELSGVEEAREALRTDGRLLPARLPDPRPALANLAVPGCAVEPLALRDLASVLVVAADLRRLPAEGGPPRRPVLDAIRRRIPDLAELARPVVRHVEADGTLGEGASAELDRLRRAIARTGEKLRRQMESFLHDPSAGAVVRDDFVTRRNGRFVIPIRADAPKQVRGIVHGASSSGATLFVEPLEAVEWNNELVRLAEAEAAEGERVIHRWSERFRDRLEEVEVAVDALVRIDTLQARALWANEEGAVRPAVEEDGPFDLVGLKHPLLDRRLRETGAGGCVPIRLVLDPGSRVLVLSGPNAGGKTVALKATGLAFALAHCGIPVPASEASLPRLAQLRADIGDHQSIDADLSTFSAHLRAVGEWLATVRRPALFLFDEIGTGTEPAEGAALAQSVLERLRDLGVTVVATTHQAPLKSWAMTARGVSSAALEFDEVRLRPTYRVVPGVAGTSAGIEIAARLGLPAELVDRAKEILGTGGREAETLLARLRGLTASLEERSSALATAEADLALERARFEERSRREAEKRREEAARVLEGLVADFRREAEREIAGLTDRKLRAKLEKERIRAESRLRSKAAEAQARVAPEEVRVPTRPESFAPRAGERVRVVSLERDGVVAALRGDRVEVLLGSVGMTVRAADLAPAGGDNAAPEGAAARPAVTERDLEGPGAELHLLGMTVEEALPAVDRYLDRASRGGIGEVRLIHGHGTGRLRAAVRSHVKGHPLAVSFRPGGPGEGGDGVTVVRLR
jgi:DNA mismatch repair protein MutS2